MEQFTFSGKKRDNSHKSATLKAGKQRGDWIGRTVGTMLNWLDRSNRQPTHSVHIGWRENSSAFAKGRGTTLRSFIETLRDTFWFIPGVLTALAAVLGLTMPYVDASFETFSADSIIKRVVYNAGPEGARAVLTTIAGSSITVAATVFSITIATLTLTSSQFGPRLLRTFTTDRGVQFSLGTFVATFVYPLLVLRVVRVGVEDGDRSMFVPHLSITVAIVLALLSVAVLIYFVHHVALIIRAPQVINAVGNELDSVLDRTIPSDGRYGDSEATPDSEAQGEPRAQMNAPKDAAVVARAGFAGYVIAIDTHDLVKRASKVDSVFWIMVSPGSYVFAYTPLLVASLEHADKLEKDALEIAEQFGIGARRTLLGDPTFGINQLTEIAQRAMSPGINDPFTCQTCIDRLGASLARIAARPLPDARRRDEQGVVRAICQPLTWDYLIDSAFDPIRRYGRGDAAVLGRMLETLTKLKEATPLRSRREVLSRHADLILAASIEPGNGLDESDRAIIRSAHASFTALDDGSAFVR